MVKQLVQVTGKVVRINEPKTFTIEPDHPAPKGELVVQFDPRAGSGWSTLKQCVREDLPVDLLGYYEDDDKSEFRALNWARN